MSGGSILAVNSLDYAPAHCRITTVKSGKLNDTVLTNLWRYSEPVRTYLHQICSNQQLGFPVRHAQFCACAVCELLAELLALKRFNTVKSQQRFSRRSNTVDQTGRHFRTAA